MPQAVLDVRGRRHTWGITTSLPQATIDAMNEDGIEVGTLGNVIPVWVAELGYPAARAWCFCQDAWNFKNPFR